MTEKISKKSLFGFIPVYKLIESETGFKKYVLGIPYSSSRVDRECAVSRTFFKMLKKEKSYFCTKYYFLGIKIWHKNKSKIDILTEKIFHLDEETKNNFQSIQNIIITEIRNDIRSLISEMRNNIPINAEIRNNLQLLFKPYNPNYFLAQSEYTDDHITAENRYIEPIKTTNCKICGCESKLLFKSKIFQNKYDAEYYYCPNCGFLQVENLEWLEESYKTPITQEDTGVLYRNIELRKYIAIILFNILSPNGKYLDYGGGYGLLTRLLRDIGFEYYHYDKYCQNVVAQGFEGSLTGKYDAITSIETFEHFANPLQEIEQMLKLSDTIIFTEEILPSPIPEPSEWGYYCLNHGQHISFYSHKTLKYIANKYGLHYLHLCNIPFLNLHILSKHNHQTKADYLKKQNIDALFHEVEISMRPLYGDDMHYIIKQQNNKN